MKPPKSSDGSFDLAQGRCVDFLSVKVLLAASGTERGKERLHSFHSLQFFCSLGDKAGILRTDVTKGARGHA